MGEEINGFREDPAAIYDENGKPLADYESDARTWGTVCHLSGALVIFGIPLLHILAPLAIWVWKRKEYPFGSHWIYRILFGNIFGWTTLGYFT